jgi:hypothetical protein
MLCADLASNFDISEGTESMSCIFDTIFSVAIYSNVDICCRAGSNIVISLVLC